MNKSQNMTIDQLIDKLTALKNVHGGNVEVVTPNGTTEDDWDRYTIYNHVANIHVVDVPIGTHKYYAVIEPGINRAFKR